MVASLNTDALAPGCLSRSIVFTATALLCTGLMRSFTLWRESGKG